MCLFPKDNLRYFNQNLIFVCSEKKRDIRLNRKIVVYGTVQCQPDITKSTISIELFHLLTVKISSEDLSSKLQGIIS